MLPPLFEILNSDLSLPQRFLTASAFTLLTIALPRSLNCIYSATAATVGLSKLLFTEEQNDNPIYEIGNLALKAVHISVTSVTAAIAVTKALPDTFSFKGILPILVLPFFHEIAHDRFNSSLSEHLISYLSTTAICLYGGSSRESLPPAVN